MSSSRIPKKLVAFIVYIVAVNDYLQAIASGDTDPRGIVLGMTLAELADLKARLLLLISGDPLHPGIWDLHSNKSKKNVTTRQNMDDAMKAFGIFFRPVLNRMASNVNITNFDRNILNIARPVISHVKPSAPIVARCFVDVVMLGQGEVKFACRATADSARSSKAEGSDAVEIAWCSLPFTLAAEGDPSLTAGKVRPRSLSSPDDGTTKEIYTKAVFQKKFPGSEIGNLLQFFLRWINTKHPELNGPWSQVNGIVIS
jgi:hypothetical protein